MIETIERTIKDSKYAVTQMTARRALRMKSKLLKVFGSSLAQILIPSGDKNKKVNVLGLNKKDTIEAIKNLSGELDEKTFENIVVELLQGVRKDGMELTEYVIDSEFAGDLGTLFKVIFFVLEVNFSSFLEEMGISMSQEVPE